jgi:hypothetical protein
VTGQIGGALDFDGDGDYVDVGTMGNFGSSIDNVTISAWVKSNVTNAPMSVLGTVNIISGIGLTQVRVTLNQNAGGDTQPGYISLFTRDEDLRRLSGSVNTNTGITDGNWHNVVVIFCKSSNTIAMYLDSLEKTITYYRRESPTNYGNFNRNLYIGACHVDIGMIYPFDGSIDDFRIYDTALTGTEVFMLYNNVMD